MALSVGAFKANLSLDTSGYASGILTAQSLNAAFGQTVTSLVNDPLTTTIGLLKQAIAEGTAYAESVSNIASEADVSAETVQVLGEVLEDKGKSFEGAGAAIQRFTLRLGELQSGAGAVADELRELGLDPNTFADTDDAIRRTIEALAALDNRKRASYLAAQLFEKQYGRAIADAVRSSGGSIDQLVAKYRDLGSVVSETQLAALNSMDEFADETNNRVQGLSRGVASAFAEGFNDGVKGSGGLKEISGLTETLKLSAEALGDLIGKLISLLSKLASLLVDNDLFRSARELLGGRDGLLTELYNPSNTRQLTEQGSANFTPGMQRQLAERMLMAFTTRTFTSR